MKISINPKSPNQHSFNKSAMRAFTSKNKVRICSVACMPRQTLLRKWPNCLRIWKKGHNMRVLGIEKLTESNVKNIKLEQDQRYHQFNAHGSRAEFNSHGSRAEFNAHRSRAEFNGKASRSEYNGMANRSGQYNGKGSDSQSERSRGSGEEGSGHSREHWHHGHGQFSKREGAMLKSDMIIEK